MFNNTKYNTNKKLRNKVRVENKLIIDPEHTLIGLKSALKVVKDIARRGGTILLVGNSPKYKYIMQSYNLEVGQPFMYRSWVNGLLSNEALLKDHLMRHGFKIDRAPMSDWLRRNKVSDFLMKYEGYINNLKQPSLVVFINTSTLGDALDEVNALNIPSIGLATTSMDASQLTYPIPSNDQSLKTISLFVALIKQSITEGTHQRKRVLKYLEKRAPKKLKQRPTPKKYRTNKK